jgi:hypothetical protein
MLRRLCVISYGDCTLTGTHGIRYIINNNNNNKIIVVVVVVVIILKQLNDSNAQATMNMKPAQGCS